MKTEVREIDPKTATRMLKRNGGNRKLSDSHVLFLAAEMEKGNWLFDGQPIRLNDSGRVLDGQHRLNAIVRSNTAQKFLIVSGVEQAAFKVMDTGKIRGAADVLSIKGVDNSVGMAATTKAILSFEKGSSTTRYSNSNKISNTDVLDFIENTPGLGAIFNEARVLYFAFNKVLPAATIASFKYLMNQKNVVDSKKFWDKVCHGLDLEKDSPERILRNKLIANKISKAKLPTMELKALIIKAWNSSRTGKEIKFLRWNKENEKFPKIM